MEMVVWRVSSKIMVWEGLGVSWARISPRIGARIRPRWVKMAPSWSRNSPSWTMLAPKWRNGAQDGASWVDLRLIWGRFWSYFCIYFQWKTHQNKYWFFNDFWVDFDWMFRPFWMRFGMFFRWLFLSHFRCDFVRILGAFCGSSTLILAIPSMRKRVFWNSA